MATNQAYGYFSFAVIILSICVASCASKHDREMNALEKFIGQDKEKISSELGDPDWEAVNNSEVWWGDDAEVVAKTKERSAKTYLAYGEFIIVLNFFDVAIRVEPLNE